jgi:hypothetical protein
MTGDGLIIVALFVGLLLIVIIRLGKIGKRQSSDHAEPQRMGLKQCPECAELVQPAAVKCRFCGASLVPAPSDTAVVPAPGEQSAPGGAAAAQEAQVGKESSSVGPVVIVALVIALIIVLAVFFSGGSAPSAAANEASAVSDVRLISTAAVSYDAVLSHGYPAKLVLLGPAAPGEQEGPVGSRLLDRALAAGEKDGYVFEYTPGAPSRGKVTKFQVIARPKNDPSNGRHFFVDESGVIRQSVGSDADKYSLPL